MKLIFVLIVAVCLFGCNKKVLVVHQEKVDLPVKVELPKKDTENSFVNVKREPPLEVKEVKEVKEEPRSVYFDFDKDDIRADEVDNLTAWVKSIHGKIVLAGYCDERGSVKYNFGLGQRRAVSVMRWLMENGMRSEIRCISYGKGGLVRTGCGDDDACHQLNRRVEFKVDN